MNTEAGHRHYASRIAGYLTTGQHHPMRTLLSLCLAALVIGPAAAQRATVFYDFAKNTFGDFEDLPSEEQLLITGDLPPGTELVEVSVYDDEVSPGEDLYTGFWTANGTTGSRAFAVPINYRLRPGSDYTFRIQFFTPVQGGDREALYRQVRKNVEAYLNLQYRTDDEGTLKLAESPRKLRRELDQIVHQSMRQYRVTSPGAFEGFSDVVLEQLKQLEGLNVQGGVAAAPPLRNLMDLVDGELRSMLNQDIVMLRNERVVSDVEAEDKPGYFSIVGGYGAVYYDGDLEDLEYDDAPFVGLGFPFSATKVAPKILRNAELSVGVFTRNLTLDGREFTGPIVGRPLFVGLDYKLFSFVRLNAGATFLEENDGDEDTFEDIDTRLRVRPFVGLSAKLNLSLSLDK